VETAIWIIELGVGLACLVLGLSALRTVRYRLVGIVLLIAGAAASGHALMQLSGG
jgi:putative copper export protein